MSQPSVKRRRYRNQRRAAQAQETRRRIRDSAHALLLVRGYGATTIIEIAQRADVSVDTIYKAFGGKAGLTKHVYDVALAGDEEPVPLAQRPEIQAILAARSPARKVELYAAVARQLGERLGPLLDVLLGARGSDAELEEFARTTEHERLVGATRFVGHLDETGGLRGDLDIERARDTVWTLISPEVYLLLVHRRGWHPDDYQHWLTHALGDALLRTRPRRQRQTD
jgi:AcrR family transcriptional regulator